MITIDSRSMVLNDVRSPCRFRMDVTESVGASMSIQAMADLIVGASQRARGGKINNLVLNAHGSPGHFGIGVGLSEANMAPFSALQGNVHKVWFRGCLVGRIAGPHTASHGDGDAMCGFNVNNGNGHQFLSSFAKLTGCHLVAPTEMQGNGRASYPYGQMDSYEGLLLAYNPQGVITWRHRYPSLYGYDVSNTMAMSPNRE